MASSPHDKAARAARDHRPIEAQYARQGRGGRRIMVVLIVALAFTALGFALVLLSWSRPLAEAPVDNGGLPEAAHYFKGDATPASSEGPAKAPDR